MHTNDVVDVIDSPQLARLRTCIDLFRDSLHSADAPVELLHVIGLLNGFVNVYDRTSHEHIDYTDAKEPLVALPQQIKYLETKLNSMFERMGTVAVKIKTD